MVTIITYKNVFGEKKIFRPKATPLCYICAHMNQVRLISGGKNRQTLYFYCLKAQNPNTPIRGGKHKCGKYTCGLSLF